MSGEGCDTTTEVRVFNLCDDVTRQYWSTLKPPDVTETQQSRLVRIEIYVISIGHFYSKINIKYQCRRLTPIPISSARLISGTVLICLRIALSLHSKVWTALTLWLLCPLRTSQAETIRQPCLDFCENIPKIVIFIKGCILKSFRGVLIIGYYSLIGVPFGRNRTFCPGKEAFLMDRDVT